MSNPDSYVNVPILHESPIVHQENPVCEEIPLRCCKCLFFKNPLYKL